MISPNEPEAVTKLREKLAEVDKGCARLVEANKAVRSKRPCEGHGPPLGFLEERIERALTSEPTGRIRFPACALSNAAIEAGRLGRRIEKRARKTCSTPAPGSLEAPGECTEEATSRVCAAFACAITAGLPPARDRFCDVAVIWASDPQPGLASRSPSRLCAHRRTCTHPFHSMLATV